ncbi:Fic family protein [Microvirga sp. 2YAF29]|uniref:Fic family protein n=1 Tax=Microvirga sp. 2YAF29 TaxID=3233031 RepID=UPI003F9936A7
MTDRHSHAQIPELITDEEERARREAENGIRQFNMALEIIRVHVKDPERPFRLRSGVILQLNEAALKGIHSFAGTFRNTPVAIGGSRHNPPEAFMVSDEVQDLCSYVNENWNSRSATHLGAYVLWKLNWIHPFADGNGRTSRAISYVVTSIKLDSILPGTPTIPDQIAGDKDPYYNALEKADDAWLDARKVDVSALEEMLEQMLARQLLNATREAAGESCTNN